MLVVIANVVVKNGKSTDFIVAAQDCIANTRKEKGNLSYTLFANTEDERKLSFVEEWESQAALDEHVKTSHFIALIEKTKDMLAEPMKVDVYKAEKLA